MDLPNPNWELVSKWGWTPDEGFTSRSTFQNSENPLLKKILDKEVHHVKDPI